eukprot:140473-Rhodomonas_salina.1
MRGRDAVKLAMTEKNEQNLITILAQQNSCARPLHHDDGGEGETWVMRLRGQITPLRKFT